MDFDRLHSKSVRWSVALLQLPRFAVAPPARQQAPKPTSGPLADLLP